MTFYQLKESDDSKARMNSWDVIFTLSVNFTCSYYHKWWKISVQKFQSKPAEHDKHRN